MTLQQWADQHNIVVGQRPDNGPTYVTFPMDSNVRAELFHLTDFIVSSVTGGVIWLVKKEPAP